jgi:predicted Zn-dependent protease
MYAAVLRLNPENAEAKEIVTMIEAGGGAPLNLARVAKPSAAAAKPGEGSDLMAEATRRIEEGQYAGAEAMLTQLLSREPGNPEICQLLARLHLLQGNLQVALGEYRFLAGAALRAQDYVMAESLISRLSQGRTGIRADVGTAGRALSGKRGCRHGSAAFRQGRGNFAGTSGTGHAHAAG